MCGLASFPFARHYLGNHCCFLFLPLLRCFSSRRVPPYSYLFTIRQRGFAPLGFPIRICTARWLFAPPRTFSQLSTSFFGSRCQGILPLLFITCSFYSPLPSLQITSSNIPLLFSFQELSPEYPLLCYPSLSLKLVSMLFGTQNKALSSFLIPFAASLIPVSKSAFRCFFYRILS